MKSSRAKPVATAFLLASLAGAAGAAAQQQDFPAERSKPASCADVKWHQDMLRNHPGLIDACREVVLVNGETWARFESSFVRVEPDGEVIFSVRDRDDRSLEEVRLLPAPGQLAYIDNQPTPFAKLRTTDSINLYVPEGGYGFATEPGVAADQLATVTVPATRQTTLAQQTVAQRDPLPEVLPRTAGPLPWIALGGLLSLAGGVLLGLRRRFTTRSA